MENQGQVRAGDYLTNNSMNIGHQQIQSRSIQQQHESVTFSNVSHDQLTQVKSQFLNQINQLNISHQAQVDELTSRLNET